VRRRYNISLANLKQAIEICDKIAVYDNTHAFCKIAVFEKGNVVEPLSEKQALLGLKELWHRLCRLIASIGRAHVLCLYVLTYIDSVTLIDCYPWMLGFIPAPNSILQALLC
jgi:hypothetical protein